MTKLNKKLLSVIATGSLLFNIAAPVFATGTDLTITGNGADSENEIELESTNKTNVSQNNFANVTNMVFTNSNTGGNQATKNTGGNVGISTGDADSRVNVSNVLNKNSAEVKCCDSGDLTVKIAGNGADAENEAELELSNEIAVQQNNDAIVKNDVKADAVTGENDSDKNTGGDVEIVTGDADTRVGVSTTANSNSAKVGGANQRGSLSALILDNGAESENEIDLDIDLSTGVYQDNYADVTNTVKAKAETGDNDADKNTGGEVVIGTGDAVSIVGIDNMLNFNWAEVDCCGLLDVTTKIAGNGADSENEIDLDLDSEVNVVQGGEKDAGNYADVDNFVWAKASTGDNDADKNTGGEVGITTGDADLLVGIDNLLNFNFADVDCCLTGLSAKVEGNGADSENEIEVEKESTRGTWQDNFADLLNKLGGGSETGDNTAKANTAGHEGDPTIETGDSTSAVSVVNEGNVNQDGGTLSMPDVEFNVSWNWSAFISHLVALF